MFRTRRALGHARQVANLHRVRVQELETALAELLAAVDSLPVAVEVTPSTQARTNLRDGHPFAVRYAALTNPLFQGRVAAARRTLGVQSDTH